MYLIRHFAFRVNKTTMLKITYPVLNSALEQAKVELRMNEFQPTTSLPPAERGSRKSPLMSFHVTSVTMQLNIQFGIRKPESNHSQVSDRDQCEKLD